MERAGVGVGRRISAGATERGHGRRGHLDALPREPFGQHPVADDLDRLAGRDEPGRIDAPPAAPVEPLSACGVGRGLDRSVDGHHPLPGPAARSPSHRVELAGHGGFILSHRVARQGKWVFTRRIEACAKPQAPGVSQAAQLSTNGPAMPDNIAYRAYHARPPRALGEPASDAQRAAPSGLRAVPPVLAGAREPAALDCLRHGAVPGSAPTGRTASARRTSSSSPTWPTRRPLTGSSLAAAGRRRPHHPLDGEQALKQPASTMTVPSGACFVLATQSMLYVLHKGDGRHLQ